MAQLVTWTCDAAGCGISVQNDTPDTPPAGWHGIAVYLKLRDEEKTDEELGSDYEMVVEIEQGDFCPVCYQVLKQRVATATSFGK